MAYSGSCHCGTVTFTVAAEAPNSAISCNCSHCRRKGLLLNFVPADQFKLGSGDENLTEYLFNKHKIRHQFCATCGVQPFAYGEQGGTKMAAINLRCVPDIDLDALEIQKFDGASS